MSPTEHGTCEQDAPGGHPAHLGHPQQRPVWGRHCIAMTVWALGVFVAASTVRNILLRPRPRKAPAAAVQADAGQ